MGDCILRRAVRKPPELAIKRRQTARPAKCIHFEFKLAAECHKQRSSTIKYRGLPRSKARNLWLLSRQQTSGMRVRMKGVWSL